MIRLQLKGRGVDPNCSPYKTRVIKCIVAKIQSEAKNELLMRVKKWNEIKGILEENYLVKRTLEFYFIPELYSILDRDLIRQYLSGERN